MAEDTLIRTGIEGFDDLLHGGIPKTNVILVEGGVGSGKTLFGVEFIYRGITEFNEPGIIVVFETSPAKLIRDAATMGWDLPALQAQKKLQIIFTSPQVIEQELRSADSLLLEMAVEIGAQRIFIDGIGLLHQSSNVGVPMPFIGPGSYRELLQQLLEGLVPCRKAAVGPEALQRIERVAPDADPATVREVLVHHGAPDRHRHLVGGLERP